MIKYLTIGFILVQSLRMQPSMIGKTWQQELESTDHIVPIVRKQREMSISTQLAFSFFFSQGPIMMLPTLRMGFLTSVNLDNLTQTF